MRSAHSDKETALQNERKRTSHLQQAVDSLRSSPTQTVVQSLQLSGDPESGRCDTSLADLGFADFETLQTVDRGLQYLSALMALRSDVRLSVFGVWLLCHLIYMANIFYEHFLQSHFRSSHK